jgi:hypothetical protein
MAKNIKPSTTGIATDSPISVYAGSKENADLLASQKKVFPGNVVGAAFAASTELGVDDVDFEVDLIAEDITEEKNRTSETTTEVTGSLNPPTLSDITVVSNQVVYDASGNPSVTVVLKIKNSTGQEIKGINARIQSI